MYNQPVILKFETEIVFFYSPFPPYRYRLVNLLVFNLYLIVSCSYKPIG